MALVLTKAGISTGNTVEAYHVTQSIDAFTGTDAYDIILSGSFTLTGSFNWDNSSSPTSYPGYTYQEIDIASPEILNIGTFPIEILPALVGNKYYDTITSMEYTFGTAPYTGSISPNISLRLAISSSNVGYSDNLNIHSNTSSFQAIFSKEPIGPTCFNDGIILTNQINDNYTTGDGTIKVKVWYKIINFG